MRWTQLLIFFVVLAGFCVAQDTNLPPQYRMRLETPSMTVEETAGYMNAVANAVANQTSAPPAATETAPAPRTAAAASRQFVNVGVTGTIDPQSLLTRGYGLSLGEVAAYWKTHQRTVPHTYTNEDVARMPRRPIEP